MNKKVSQKILAFLTISSFSAYTIFAQQDLYNAPPNDCPTDLKFYLSRGSTDSRTKGEVTKVQKFIKQVLNLPDNKFLVTGSYGKVTAKYVAVWQKQNGLSATGVIGGVTRRKIIAECGGDTCPDCNNPYPTDPNKKNTNSTYKDGNYKVKTTYSSPGGSDDLEVSLALKDNNITNVTVTNEAHDGASRSFQNNFINGIENNSCPTDVGQPITTYNQIGGSYSQTYYDQNSANVNSNFKPENIIGKNINNLSVGIVCGASLTTRSFNEALEKIRAIASGKTLISTDDNGKLQQTTIVPKKIVPPVQSIQTQPVKTIVTPTPVPTPPPVIPPTPKTKYKNGTFSTTASYDSPGGMDNLGVSITIVDDKVTGVNVTDQAQDRTSKRYQDKFISGISGAVVGKSLDGLSVGVVSGASLTSGGFNTALDTLRSQAKN